MKRLPGKIFRWKKQKLLWRFIIKFIRTCLRQAVNIQGKREVTNEQTKKICDFSKSGLFVNSLGVSLITKASLGTSPISSIPYVLSLSFPFTLGNFTIFFSIFLILLQLLILRKNFKLEHVLQIPVSIIFGYFIDLTMLLFAWVNPQVYIMKIIYLLIGCLILGFGVYMEVLADVVMLPGESFVSSAIVLTWKTNFGTTEEICFDVSMSVIAAVLSFRICRTTWLECEKVPIIAALLVGFIARVAR